MAKNIFFSDTYEELRYMANLTEPEKHTKGKFGAISMEEPEIG